MMNIPVSNTARAKAIVIGAGVASILVSQFMPQWFPLLNQILAVLGIGSVGVGAAQIVQSPVVNT